MTNSFCMQCGNRNEPGAQYCAKCGASILHISSVKSTKSPLVALFLCLFLGILGIHRFYVGKIGTGLLMLITLGGFGIWVLIDLIFIITNNFEDSDGNKLILMKHPSSLKKGLLAVGAIIAAFFVYASLVIILVLYLTSGMMDTIRDQLSALRKGNIEKAYSYTSADFQKATSFEDFKNFVDEYPSLKNNEKAFFNKRKIQDYTGMVKGTLTAKDGAKTPIEFRLIKENGSWKILGITVQPTGAGIKIDEENENTSSDELTKTYENPVNRYAINYPSNWEYIHPEKATVIFSGKRGTPTYYTTVNIQTILTKKDGGKYATLDEFMSGLKKEILKNAIDAKILEEGAMELPSDPKNFQGKYLIFTYTYRTQAIKQMQIVFLRKDNLAFYTWAYTAPAERYTVDMPIAKAMYESWVIK